MVNEKIANQKSKLSYVVQVMFFFIASIFVGTGIYEVIPLSYVLQRSLHVGEEKVVLISSSFSLGYAVGFLIFGWLANYVETKKLLIIGLILLMISTFTVGFATTYANMIVLRVIQGSYTCILFIGATMGPIVATNIMNGTGSYSLSFVFLAIVLGISFIISVIIGRSRNVNCN